MGKKIKTVLMNVCVFLVLLISLELLCQGVIFAVKRYVYFMHSSGVVSINRMVFETHPYLLGWPKNNIRVKYRNKIITTTDMHTRWTGADMAAKNTVKVAVLGGSTAFCAGVTDTETWPAILQSKLGPGYAVVNYGVPGYSTAEAIIQMSLLVPEIKPDIVIFYLGWNDIRNYHYPDFSPDYYKRGLTQLDNLGISSRPPGFGEFLMSNSAIVHLSGRFARLLPKSMQPKLPPTFTTPDPEVDRIYLRNLKTLKLLSENLGARVIFAPQVLNNIYFTGTDTSDFWTPYIQDAAMPGLIKHFNGIMQQVCPLGDSKCVFLESIGQHNWQPNDFLDKGHFTKSGGEKFAEVVYQAIMGMAVKANQSEL